MQCVELHLCSNGLAKSKGYASLQSEEYLPSSVGSVNFFDLLCLVDDIANCQVKFLVGSSNVYFRDSG